MLMQHESGFHLDDVLYLQGDTTLQTLLGLEQIPKAASLSNWLRRMGKHPRWNTPLAQVNQTVLQLPLHKRKAITLDIDATEIMAGKADARWTNKSNRRYMPMVGYIAETGQIVACDFREGNTPPAKDNLNIIHQCQDSLPEGCYVKTLRIDVAGYQTDIIKYCDQQRVAYAVRAKMSAYLKDVILSAPENDWQPVLNRKGDMISGHSTYPTVHFIGDYEQTFTVVVAA